MIVFNNISLKRGQTELLENATATINPKQKVGLVGKNGCGKSSLFALLKKTGAQFAHRYGSEPHSIVYLLLYQSV